MAEVVLVSIVAPVFDEEDVLPLFYDRVSRVRDSFGGGAELILVNDGSRDGTAELLDGLAARDPALEVVHLSRNFGHQAALTAGLDVATGECVVVLDADLQDPPELVPEMVELFRRGFDVVYARRRERREEAAWRLGMIRLFYWGMARLIHPPLPEDAGDYRLMSRRVVDVMRSLPEATRFHRGLAAWAGFRQTELVYDREGRAAGRTKYPLRKLVSLALDGLTSFTYLPLRLATWAGMGVIGFTLVYMAWVAQAYVVGRDIPHGWLSLASLLALLNGAVLLFLGVIGEYVGRIFQEVKRRPPYIVAETRNLALDPGRRATGGYVAPGRDVRGV